MINDDKIIMFVLLYCMMLYIRDMIVLRGSLEGHSKSVKVNNAITFYIIIIVSSGAMYE